MKTVSLACERRVFSIIERVAINCTSSIGVAHS